MTDRLTEVLRNGARALLTQAVEAEVSEFLAATADLKTDNGCRRVVRHGHLPERQIMTGIGPVAVRQPRVRDREAGADDSARIRFTPAILPPYARRSKSLDTLIPILYLKGVSTGDFAPALAALLGKDAVACRPRPSRGSRRSGPTNISDGASGRWRAKATSTSGPTASTSSALEDEAQCILVLMGATAEGKKELIAICDGQRESEQTWKDLLLDCKRRGLSMAPKVAVGDGALGFWKAIGEVWPKTREQRCWVHKTANILDKLPKSQQPKAKRMLQDIWMAETRKDAEAAFDVFVETYGVKYEKAAECLKKDRDPLLASTTSRPNIGNTCARRIRSKAPSQLSDTGRPARRDASRTRRRLPWCSSWSKARRRRGVALTATTSCQRSFEV